MSLQQVYWLVSSLLLGLGAVLTVMAFDKILHNPSPLHSAFAAQLLIHSITIVNFLPSHLFSLFTKQMQDGWWCRISGMISIVEVFSMLFNTLVVGSVVRQQFHHYQLNPSKDIIKGLLIGWSLGWSIAFLYLIARVIGPFHGLYCCLDDVGNPLVLTPYLILVFLTLIYLVFCFEDALHIMSDMQACMEGATDRMLFKHKEHMQRLVHFGMILVLSFYSFWALGSILAIVEASGTPYPLWLDVLAGWLYKLQIILDACIVLYY